MGDNPLFKFLNIFVFLIIERTLYYRKDFIHVVMNVMLEK